MKEESKIVAQNPLLQQALVSGSAVFNMDCIEFMKQVPDNFFHLAIVDPPYGLKIAKNGKLKANSKFDRGFKKDIDYGVKDWDNNVPTEEYWRELFRVSKNQIVWGGNYFIDYLKPTQCFLIWDKMNGTNPMADAEFAWTSIENKVARIFRMHHFSDGYDDKIHPTQKPTKLYDWILKNFAKEGNLILDTHLWSGSSRIACSKNGYSFVGFEVNKTYYDNQEKRFKDFVSQLRMF